MWLFSSPIQVKINISAVLINCTPKVFALASRKSLITIDKNLANNLNHTECCPSLQTNAVLYILYCAAIVHIKQAKVQETNG